MHNLDLTISDISKIEGKASCDIKVKEGKVADVKFSIAEYRRFYIQAIKGKDIIALPQLTARICGTCSNAHLLCAIKAVENAIGLEVSPQTIALRKLLNYGLIIRDHALHLYVFVLPDLFGKDSILDFDENDNLEHKFLDDTFSVKAAGNFLGKIVGGRSVHAPYPQVGGFTKLPTPKDLITSSEELKKIRPLVMDLIDLFAQKDISLIRIGLSFSCIMDREYSFLYGSPIISDNTSIPYEKYGDYLEHIDISHSKASGYRFNNRIYTVGALSRLNLAQNNLHPKTKESISKYLGFFPSQNIFHNNLAQAIEILHAIDSSIDIIESLKLKEEKVVPPLRKKGQGIGIIEAPRGTLFYKLNVNSEGKIIDGQIVVPTGQNQLSIGESIRDYLETNIKNLDSKEVVEAKVERIVRAYDPCMSCASHFLKFRWSQ